MTITGTRRRAPERGSAMLVTVIIVAALLAGGSVLASMQMSSTRATGVMRSGMAALYCAEGGLAAARVAVAASQSQWGPAIAASAGGDTSEPSWLSDAIGSHDLDGNGSWDFEVYIKDNADEASGPDNPSVDNDMQLYIVVTCTAMPETPKQVQELVLYNGGSACMPEQLGGMDNNGNKNDGC